jgi:hypothetical protein
VALVRTDVSYKSHKGPLGKPRIRAVDNAKMDFVKTGWSVVNWIGPSQDKTSGRLL